MFFFLNFFYKKNRKRQLIYRKVRKVKTLKSNVFTKWYKKKYKKLHKRTARINNTSLTRNELINDKTKLSLRHVTVKLGLGLGHWHFHSTAFPPTNTDTVQIRPITTLWLCLCLTFLAVSLFFFLSTLLLSLS